MSGPKGWPAPTPDAALGLNRAVIEDSPLSACEAMRLLWLAISGHGIRRLTVLTRGAAHLQVFNSPRLSLIADLGCPTETGIDLNCRELARGGSPALIALAGHSGDSHLGSGSLGPLEAGTGS